MSGEKREVLTEMILLRNRAHDWIETDGQVLSVRSTGPWMDCFLAYIGSRNDTYTTTTNSLRQISLRFGSADTIARDTRLPERLI